MRRLSEKKMQELLDYNEIRFEYKCEFPSCMLCGGQTSDVHEIARGVHRHESVKWRAAWLSLCRFCHGKMDRWTIPQQLALKALRDPESYDREKVNELRGRALNAVTENEVWRELQWVILRCGG